MYSTHKHVLKLFVQMQMCIFLTFCEHFTNHRRKKLVRKRTILTSGGWVGLGVGRGKPLKRGSLRSTPSADSCMPARTSCGHTLVCDDTPPQAPAPCAWSARREPATYAVHNAVMDTCCTWILLGALKYYVKYCSANVCTPNPAWRTWYYLSVEDVRKYTWRQWMVRWMVSCAMESVSGHLLTLLNTESWLIGAYCKCVRHPPPKEKWQNNRISEDVCDKRLFTALVTGHISTIACPNVTLLLGT